jgi:hypothetical protein
LPARTAPVTATTEAMRRKPREAPIEAFLELMRLTRQLRNRVSRLETAPVRESSDDVQTIPGDEQKKAA